MTDDENAEPLSTAEWSLAFERSYQMSVGAVINRTMDRHGGEARVGLFNPSVGDFALRQFAADAASLESFFALLRDYRSLAHFEAVRKSGIVSDAVFIAVVRNLATRFWREPLLTPEFASDLASFIATKESLVSALRSELESLSAQFFEIAKASARPEALSDFAVFTVKDELIPADDDRWLEFTRMVIEQTIDDGELIELSNLVNALEDPVAASAATDLAQHVISCWKDKISEAVGDNGIAVDYTDDDSYDSYDKAKEELTTFVRDSLSEYAIAFDRQDIEAIVGEFDLREHLRNNRLAHREYEGGGGDYSGGGVSG